MAAEPCVRVPGIVFASLAFQHVNADSDVEGLILGESRLHEHVTISDSQADHIHIEEVYNVQKHLACQRLNSLYSSSGQVNMEELQKLLVDNKQDSVIGWYRQRRNSEQQMTFREKLVHDGLREALSNPQLLFLLLTPSQVTPTGSTHKMEYSAFLRRSRRLLNVPVLVTNLGQLEQQGYWEASAPCSAAGYSLTMRKHRFFCSDGTLREVTEVKRMNDTLQEQLQAACRDLECSERRLETLQEEVSALRTELREKQPREARKERGGGGGGGGGGGAAVQRNNVMLQEAVYALFGYAPLLLTQTVTPDGFPVPLVDVSMATRVNSGAEPPPSTATCRKRPRGAESEGKDRKCRRKR